jgi:hypothetical protein
MDPPPPSKKPVHLKYIPPVSLHIINHSDIIIQITLLLELLSFGEAEYSANERALGNGVASDVFCPVFQYSTEIKSKPVHAM